jgi:hypothetical protein
MSAIDHIEIRYRVNHADGTYGPWTYQTIKPDQTTFDIRKVTRNGTYTVQVRAVSLTGVSSDWAEAIHVVQDQGLVVAPPNSITVVGVADGVSVRWAVSGRAQPGSTYRVERAPDVAGAPGTWVILGTTKGLLWHDGVTDGGLYWYRVQTVSYSNDRSTYVTASTFSKAKTAVDGVAVDIQNPFFDAGDVGWAKTGGWAILNNLGLALSGTWVAKKPTGSSSGTLTNAALIPVNAGQRVSSRAFLQSASSANGTGAAGVEWLDVTLSSLGVVLGVSLSAAACNGSWQPSPLCQALAPPTARFCRSVVQVNGHTAGDWYCDNDYLYVDTSQVPTGSLTNAGFDNQFPNPTSEVLPPDGADGTTAEWAFRFNAGIGTALDGAWVRRIPAGQSLSWSVSSVREEVQQFSAYMIASGGATAVIKLEWFDSVNGSLASQSLNSTAGAYTKLLVAGRTPSGAVKVTATLSATGTGSVDFDAILLRRFSPNESVGGILFYGLLPGAIPGGDCAYCDNVEYVSSVTNWGSNAVIVVPLNAITGSIMTFKFKNTSAGAWTSGISFPASFKMAAWTPPASGKSSSFTLRYDGTNWVECARSGDIPN